MEENERDFTNTNANINNLKEIANKENKIKKISFYKTKKFWIAILISSSVIGIILLISLIINSFVSLNPGEIGLDYDHFNARINKLKLYYQGRHFLGVGHSFIKFPIGIISVFNNSTKLECRTKVSLYQINLDGLNVNISFSFQYSLKDNINEIYSLFNKYGENYQNAYISIVKDRVNEGVSKYKTEQLFSQRGNITESIQNYTNVIYNSEHAYLVSFQLLELDIPEKIREVLLTTEKQNFMVQIAKNTQEYTNTNLSADKSKAMIVRDTITKKSDMLTLKYTYKCQIIAENSKNYIKSILPSLLNIKSSLKFLPKDFISYLYTLNLKKSHNKKIIQNVPIPNILNCISDASLNVCK